MDIPNSSTNNNNAQRNRFVTVELLDRTTVQVNVDAKAIFYDIFARVCKQIGLKDTQIFGLASKTDENEFEFLDLECKICKKAPKQWKSAHQGLGKSGKPLLSLSLRVQYYVDHTQLISDPQARHHYYLQLRENFINYGFDYPDDRCFLLSSYAIQADHGRCASFDPRKYFPAWVVEKHGAKYIRKHMPTIHKGLEGLSKEEAELIYIKDLCCHSPAAYNLHLYKLHASKTDTQGKLLLGVGVRGLEFYEINSRGFINFLSACMWTQIEKINFLKRKLEILVSGRSLVFYTHCEEWSKYLFNFAKKSHMVQMGLQKEVCQLNESLNEKAKFRESYIYSDDTDLEWEREQSLIGSTLSLHGKASQSTQDLQSKFNRFSNISTTSSNTTSGIVSDRMCLSFDGSQEDFLCGGKIIQTSGSHDSLLEESATKSRPVQRATSEPSKKFEQLRQLKVKQPQALLSRRAVSDETVTSQQDTTEHTYENVASVHQELMINRPQAATPVLSSSMNNMLAVAPEPNRRFSSAVYATQSVYNPQLYTTVYMTPSMEQLLSDYVPPPSYNEFHEKQRQQILASQLSGVSEPYCQPAVVHMHKKAASCEDSPTTAHKAVQAPSTSAEVCFCHSHPEIDKLRGFTENMSLPMITALCNDKLLQPPKTCSKCASQVATPPSPRPISWHSESFTFPDNTRESGSQSVPSTSSAINCY